jgi:hypothetical protein
VSRISRSGKGLGAVGKVIKAMPRTVGVEVSRQAAPALTGAAGGSWDAGQTVYGDARPLGVHGNTLDLRVTGAARSFIRFVAAGTRLTASLPLKYFRYLIGKYQVMPVGASPLPRRWTALLQAIVDKTITRKVAQA